MMAKAGLTPKQVIAASTRDAARCQKIDGEVGTLSAGAWADFVALDADPLTDISSVRKIEFSLDRGKSRPALTAWRRRDPPWKSSRSPLSSRYT